MNEIGIKDQRFSVGVSFSGIPREKAAKALGRLFGAEPENITLLRVLGAMIMVCGILISDASVMDAIGRRLHRAEK